MLKILISVVGAAVLVITGCFTAYLFSRDSIKEHTVKIEYIEKSYNEQKLALKIRCAMRNLTKETFAGTDIDINTIKLAI